MTRDEAYWHSLVHELVSLPAETGWVEFKHNNSDPQALGEYISALANSAALDGKAKAYLLWGVDDASHALVGTDFDPARKRIGAEELESWLLRQLEPKAGHSCCWRSTAPSVTR
jgi:ATP-dependent DNA helicase RecG